jgi:23S rRNA (cytosine1962-C5)-methyltransferase
MTDPAILELKPGREKSLIRRHPWIFSGAVAGVRGHPEPGETLEVRTADGAFLARAAYSPHSQIRARVWTWDPTEAVDEDFFRRRLQSALSARERVVEPSSSDACRLVHGESDGLPGLIADHYAGALVLQLLSAGPERWRDTLSSLLFELSGAQGIYERSDVDVRRLEGLPERSGVLLGPEPDGRLAIRENGLRFWVDVRSGHKTGFYLDQRINRRLVGRLAQGREVLDCFSYTGGFTLNALAAGAVSVLSVEASGEAIALARENLRLNELPEEGVDWLEGDVFQVLRGFRDRGHRFDLIILDPPKFAATAAQAERAARGYKDINLLALKLLRPGGLLATFSCSGGISADLFQKILAGAALDAGVAAQILYSMQQAPDHPVALNFPEGAYLKGLLLGI